MAPGDDDKNSGFSLQVRGIDWALVHYYAVKQGKDRKEVVRRIMSIYANADKAFDPKDFMTFVRNDLLKDESDRSLRDQLLRQVVHYAQERHLADEPTATLADAPVAVKRRNA